jgi:quercetin dioxygenase-like cupin family protein
MSKHVHLLNPDDGETLAPGVSTSFGIAVSGERMHVGMVHKARGTGSKLHQHDNEQFNLVMKGTLMGEIDGEAFKCPTGSVVHIPANTPHSIIADPDDEDVIFYVVKDTAAPINQGNPIDGKVDSARYEPGFEPKGD